MTVSASSPVFEGQKKNQKLAKGAHTSTTPRPGQREASGVTHGIVSDGEKCIPPAKSKPKKRLPVNEEEAADPVTLASILWSDEEYTVGELSRKFEGKFPIIIRVRKGFTGECLNLARSQVLQVHSYCKQKRVIACDSNKRKCSIPLDYPMNIFVRGSASGGEHWRFSAAMEVKLLPVNVKVTRVDDSANQKGACLTGAELTLLEVKDAVFLRANSIKDGWIDQSRIILIPDFLDTQFSVAVGMVSASDLEWTDYHSMFSRAVRHLKFYELTGQDHVICDACSDVHAEDQNKNQIINPLHKSSVNNHHQPLQYENLPPEPPAITTLDYKAQKRRQSETSAPNSPGLNSAPTLAQSGPTEGIKITTLDKAPPKSKRSQGSTSSREDSAVSMSVSEETGSSNGGPASQLTTVDDDSADFPMRENLIRNQSIDTDLRQLNGNADRVIVGDISGQKSEIIEARIYENTENVERRQNNNTESEFPSRNSVRFRDRVSFVPGADNSNFSSLNSNDPTSFQRSVSVEMENQKNTGLQRNLSVDSTLDHAASYQRQQSGTSETSNTGEVEGMFEPVIELASTLYDDDDDEELPALETPANNLQNSTKVNSSKPASTNGVNSAVNIQSQVPKSRPHYVRSASRISNDSVHSSQGSTRTSGSRSSSRAEIGVEPESPRTPLEISHRSLFRDREKSVKQLASAFQKSGNTDEVPVHRPKSLHVTRSSDSNRSDPSPRTEVKSPIKPAHSFDSILQIDEKIPSNESKSPPNKPEKPLPSTKPSKEKLDQKLPPKQPVKPVARPTVIISQNKTTQPSSQTSVDNSNKNNNINNVIVTPKTPESTKIPESTKTPNVAIVQPNKKPVALKSPIKSPGTKPAQQKKINPELGIEKAKDIPNELVGLGVRDVGFCLRLLELGQHEKEFERQQVDGARLCELNESLLQTNFNLTVFNASKLMRFIRGWRP